MALGNSIGWKAKVGIFALLLFIFFLLFDVTCLTGLNSVIDSLDIDEYKFYSLKGSLYTFFMLKSLRLVLLIGASFLITWWVIKPYQELVNKIKKLARLKPELAPLLEDGNDELAQAEKVLDTLTSDLEKS